MFVRTVTSLPNFPGLMGYQFFLLMVLRWRGSSATSNIYWSSSNKLSFDGTPIDTASAIPKYTGDVLPAINV